MRTNSWKKEMRHGARLFRPLMNASGSAFLPNAVANFLLGGSFLKDSANTALCYFAGRLFASAFKDKRYIALSGAPYFPSFVSQ